MRKGHLAIKRSLITLKKQFGEMVMAARLSGAEKRGRGEPVEACCGLFREKSYIGQKRCRSIAGWKHPGRVFYFPRLT